MPIRIGSILWTRIRGGVVECNSSPSWWWFERELLSATVTSTAAYTPPGPWASDRLAGMTDVVISVVGPRILVSVCVRECDVDRLELALGRSRMQGAAVY